MTTSMMALASSLMAILSLLIELGLLIWLIVSGRSSARALAIIGITLLLGARAVSFVLPMAAGALGLWAVTASTVISGLLGLAGICCLAVAFMRTDRLAALVERQRDGGSTPQTWTPGPQDAYRHDAGGPGQFPGAQQR